eukprot:7025504-Prymnesium_polylepis.1
MPHECRPSARARRTVSPRPRTSPTPGAPRHRLAARALARLAAPLPVCAHSRPRDDPGVPHPRGLRAGGRQTAPPRRAA